MQELRGYGTTTAQLLEMVAWLRQWGVQRVVMESTSTYWKGVYYLLEAEEFDCWLVNAREVKNVPGRAKTDRADAIWLAKVAERGMCRPSLVHPPEIRRLRDLTRYRRALVQDRTRFSRMRGRPQGDQRTYLGPRTKVRRHDDRWDARRAGFAEEVRPLNLCGKSTQHRGKGGDRRIAGAGRRHQRMYGQGTRAPHG